MLKPNRYSSIFSLFLFLWLLLFSLHSLAKTPQKIDFTHQYQHSFIDKHISLNNSHIVSDLEKIIVSGKLSSNEKYFSHYNLSYALFKQHKKNASLKAISQTTQLLNESQRNSSSTLDPYHLAKSLLLRAKILGILFRDTQKAIIELEKAIKINESSNNDKKVQLQFDLQTAMAQAYNQLANLTKAKTYIEQALITAEKLNNKNETIYALVISGRIAYQQENFSKAYQEYLKALQLSDEHTPKKRIASIELRLAIAYEAQNVYDQALIHAQKAVNLYSQLSEERLQIKSLRVLGNIYLSLRQDIDRALVHFINGLTIAKRINDPYSMGQIQHLIGKAYLLENNTELAPKYLQGAQDILKKSKDWFYLGLNTIEMAKLAQLNKKPTKAIELLKSVLTNQHSQNYPALVNETHKNLLKLYVEQKQYKNAYLLQQSLLSNNSEANNSDIKHTDVKNKFTKNVKLKVLNEELAKNKKSNAIFEQKLASLTKQQYFYWLIVLLLCVVIMIIYKQRSNLQKKYQNSRLNSLLTWSAFKNMLIDNAPQMTGILLIQNNSPMQRYFLETSENGSQTDQQESECFNNDENLIATLTKDPSFTNLSTYHNLLCVLCKDEYINLHPQLNLIASENDQLSFTWIDLSDFPEHISSSCLLLIELLCHYILENKQLINISDNNDRYNQISINTQAMPLIFSNVDDMNRQKVAKGIEKAIQQGLISIKKIH